MLGNQNRKKTIIIYSRTGPNRNQTETVRFRFGPVRIRFGSILLCFLDSDVILGNVNIRPDKEKAGKKHNVHSVFSVYEYFHLHLQRHHHVFP